MNWRKLSIMIVSRCANFLLGPTQFSRRYSSSISSAAITATIPNNPKGGSNASVWRGSSLLPSSDHQLRFWNSILSLGKWMKCLLFPVVPLKERGRLKITNFCPIDVAVNCLLKKYSLQLVNWYLSVLLFLKIFFSIFN